MDATGYNTGIRFAAIVALSGGLMLLPITYESPESEGWSVGTAALAAGGSGAGGSNRGGGSHTDHDHTDASHSDSDHDHSDSSHDSGHEGGRGGDQKGAKAAGRRHRGNAVGGGSKRVESWIFEQD
jgi:hypothetical protein